MSPRRIGSALLRPPDCLAEHERLGRAVEKLRESDLPALPVISEDGRLRGLFGEREFMNALFPGYLQQLGHAGFVPGVLDDVLEKRRECVAEEVAQHMNTEHVDVAEDASDVQIAEVFLHHRVLVLPVTSADGRVVGIITRTDFFSALADRFLAGS